MDTLEIWKKGVPLSRSFTKFGERTKIAEYNELVPIASSWSLIEQIAETVESGSGFLDAMKSVSRNTAPDSKRFRQLNEELRNAIVLFVKRKQLFAYGFSQPRHASDTPQEVPSDLWQGVINWDKDRLDGNGLQMSAVRIIHPSWIEAPQPQISPPHEETTQPINVFRPAGRPSRKEQIIEALHSLAENGQIDFSKPANHCYETIRLWVQANYPDPDDNEKGLRYKTMTSIVNPLFKAKKAKVLNL